MKDKTKKLLYVDMDGVLCDFMGAFDSNESGIEYPQSKVGFFLNLKPMPDAIESFNKLKEIYDIWILTKPSFKNINCYTEKAQWILNNLGYDIQKKTIICGDKSLLKGDFLIDDFSEDGQAEFEGEWINFGKSPFENWTKVVNYLTNYS
jgi:5'(3')-deoxyribonucleotidase